MHYKSNPWLFFLTLFVAHLVVSQPIVKSLDYDRYRETISEKNTSKNFRIENLPDTVNASVAIAILSGNNPRCAGDNTPITITSNVINGGQNFLLEWFNKKSKIFTNNSTVTIPNPQPGDSIYCLLTSTLDCVRKKTVKSNTIILTESASIMPKVSLVITGGSNPACSADTPLTVTAVTFNAGISPKYKWYYKNVVQNLPENQNFFHKDSISTGNQIYCSITPDISCAASNVINSAPITRSVFRSLTSLVDIATLHTINDDCSGKKYKFIATSQNQGNNPVYRWYVNNVYVGSTSGNTFTTTLKNNGDEIYATMQSSLPCANPKVVLSNVIQANDTISLPFYEDFFNTFGQPNTAKWVKNGGTYVNNTYCLQPPSANAATFDGLKWNGTPYDSINVSTSGPTDKLVSLPINLSNLQNADSVYLAFYWQFQGNGNRPEISANDKLVLYFKNNLGDWVQMWEITAANALNYSNIAISDAVPPYTVSGFNKQAVAILNGANTFLHSGFQFMLQSNGKVSGNYDIWNVDYIYLNKNQTKDLFFNDLTFSKSPESLLKNYSSMPFKHFRKNPVAFLNSEIAVTYNKLGNLQYFLNFFANVYDGLSKKFITNILPLTTGAVDAPEELQRVMTANAISPKPFQDFQEQRAEFQSTFVLGTDVDNIDGKGIAYTQNNTMSGTTVLDNFYAYDDGSAEYGIAINQKLGYIAYKFHSSQPDTITQVAISFLRSGKILVGQTFNMYITNKLTNPSTFGQDTPPQELLHKQNFLIVYPPAIDNYVAYNLSTGVAVANDFYIIIQQLSDEQLVIGWDKNTDSRKNIFYNININPTWENYTLSGGSMMIRPSFGTYRYLTEHKQVFNVHNHVAEFSIFPNPTSGVVRTNFDFDEVAATDIAGGEVNVVRNSKQIDLSALKPGLYFLYFKTGLKNVIIRVMKH